MPTVTVIYGETVKTVAAVSGDLLGDVVAATGLPLEQPCAGRGTCGKCKVLVEAGLAPPDEIEQKHLTPGERAVGNRLACRARVHAGDVQISLAPIVVYSNKIFKASSEYKRRQGPLGLAIDLGSTTVAAFLTMLDTGQVCAGGATLNQQIVYGADVISRLDAASRDPAAAKRLRQLAVASINQAVDSLQLAPRVRQRIERVTVVCNTAIHHLLTEQPLITLIRKPFQPHQKAALTNGAAMVEGIFPVGVQVALPPLIGGFVGSDALACLAYFDFDRTHQPLAAIDLGTNGEVMVTDGRRILTASTAAGPAFEGVNISCGTRAVDGAIVGARWVEDDLVFDTIANEPPIGLTGSGLLSLVHQLAQAGVVEPNGRLLPNPPLLANRLTKGPHGARALRLSPDGRILLSQWDIRELQKAKAAIRAAVDTLMGLLGLQPDDLGRVILTGSFGAQINLQAALDLGMIPPVRPEKVGMVANGAGLGAAQFLSDKGFARAEQIAAQTEQIDLDTTPGFVDRYVDMMALGPEGIEG
jgi:uncharacterized 2Fe-2S/4Fe-4S cluster protein (DUF4445 family)